MRAVIPGRRSESKLTLVNFEEGHASPESITPPGVWIPGLHSNRLAPVVAHPGMTNVKFLGPILMIAMNVKYAPT